MQELSSKLWWLIYRSDLYGTRFLLGLAEFAWAVALFWPGETFGRPTYHGMQVVMSEVAWAGVFLLTSIVQWGLLLYREYHTKRAVVFAFYNTALWVFCVVSMYMSVYPPPAAISGEFALAVGAGWIFVRSGWPTPNHVYRRITDGPSH